MDFINKETILKVIYKHKMRRKAVFTSWVYRKIDWLQLGSKMQQYVELEVGSLLGHELCVDMSWYDKGSIRKIYWEVQVKWTKPSESDRIWVHNMGKEGCWLWSNIYTGYPKIAIFERKYRNSTAYHFRYPCYSWSSTCWTSKADPWKTGYMTSWRTCQVCRHLTCF